MLVNGYKTRYFRVNESHQVIEELCLTCMAQGENSFTLMNSAT